MKSIKATIIKLVRKDIPGNAFKFGKEYKTRLESGNVNKPNIKNKIEEKYSRFLAQIK